MQMPPNSGEIIATLAYTVARRDVRIEQLEARNAELETELAALKARQAEQAEQVEPSRQG